MADTRQISRLIHSRNIVLCFFEKLFNKEYYFLKIFISVLSIRIRYTRASFTSDNNFNFSKFTLKNSIAQRKFLTASLQPIYRVREFFCQAGTLIESFWGYCLES